MRISLKRTLLMFFSFFFVGTALQVLLNGSWKGEFRVGVGNFFEKNITNVLSSFFL